MVRQSFCGFTNSFVIARFEHRRDWVECFGTWRTFLGQGVGAVAVLITLSTFGSSFCDRDELLLGEQSVVSGPGNVVCVSFPPYLLFF